MVASDVSTPLSPKVTAVVAAGAVTTVLVWLVSYFGGVDVPEPVAAAVTTILAGVAGWVVRDPLRDAGQVASGGGPAGS